MPVVSCPVCSRNVETPVESLGGDVRCPYCQAVIPVQELVFDAEEVTPVARPETAAAPVPPARFEPQRRACPVCGELIVASARKCRFCGEILDEGLKKEARRSERPEEGVEMTVADYLCAILCSVVGCFIGLVWVLQGKPAGGRMLGLSMVCGFVWIAVTAIAAAIGGAWSDPTPRPRARDRIAFVSRRDGPKRIYSMNTDGSDVRRLTNGFDDTEPSWSPDGRKIVFSGVPTAHGRSEIYLMNADGSDLKQLTRDRLGIIMRGRGTEMYVNGPAGPAWSPDGRQIAYCGTDNNNLEIFALSLDNHVSRNLTRHPGGNLFPNWSPDGRFITFQSHRDNNWEIYVMDADGANQRRLTRDPAEHQLPTWSPDGKHIAFWSSRDGMWELYLMNPDGTNQRKISNEAGRPRTKVSRAAWSPDGRYLAITVEPELENPDIFLIDVRGHVRQRLTRTPGEDSDPAWSPPMN